MCNHLDLRTPLEYAAAPGLDPFALPPAHESAENSAQETLFCFELDPEQAGRIDPQEDRFLGKLVFAAKKNGKGGNIRLPAGLYLFSQERKTLNRDDCIAMAIEQQKDGLWERLCPGNILYIRRLFEDGSPVTQLFRPYGEKDTP